MRELPLVVGPGLRPFDPPHSVVEIITRPFDVQRVADDGDDPVRVVEPEILDVGELPQVQVELVDRDQVQWLRCGGIKLR